MIFKTPLLRTMLCVLLLCGMIGRAQDTADADSTNAEGKGFHLGLYIGTLFANKYTSTMYDGYGFDVNGGRNTFINSLLYNQIVNYYGGGYGGTDYIAQILNVNHGDWSFSESDMPINMRYTVAFLVGLNTRYNLNKSEAILLNVNGTKLNINGDFSITTAVTSNGMQGAPVIHPFTITGSEKRLVFQLGYQRILGDNDKLNVFMEGGVNLTLVKFLKNQAYINYNNNVLQIDLTSIYNQPAYNYFRSKHYQGVCPGVFGGIGLHLSINPKYTIQLLYGPSYDKINLGLSPAFKLQHSIGLRAYYNI